VPAAEVADRTAILVAGMHRSGTSATAGALAKMGISLGRRLLEPGSDNPTGYWENERAVDIHERLLADLGRSWDDVRALPADWLRSAAAEQAASAIDALIGDEFAGADGWAVKDPRLCRFLPLWIEAVRKRGTRPVVLFVLRPPGEVAASIAARNGWAPALSRMLWLRYLLEAESASRGVPRAVVTYESLLRDPADVLGAALRALGIDASPGGSVLREFVDRGGRHHFGAVQGEADDSGLAALCEEVHASFERIAAGGGDWEELRAHERAFQAEWRRWGGNVDAVAAMAAEFRAQVAAAKVEQGRLASDLGAQAAWATRFVAQHDALEAERARLHSELTAQLRWSEQATARHEALEGERARIQSELTAQVAWATAFVAKHEALEAERARVQSELTAQVRWSEEFVASRAAEQAHGEASLAELRESHARALADLAFVTERLLATEQALSRESAELAHVLASRSWRITRPLRVLNNLGRKRADDPA
jgi:hypothetical protein